MNKALKLSVLSFVLLTNSPLIHAASPGLYLGGGVGYGNLGSEPGLSKIENNIFAGRIFIGYNFNQFIGIETNYIPLATTKYYIPDYPWMRGDYSLTAASVVGKIYGSFSQESPFNLYALIGGAYLSGLLDVKYNSTILYSYRESGLVPTAGLGASLDLNQNFTMGIELSVLGKKESSNYRASIPHSSMGTLSISYRI